MLKFTVEFPDSLLRLFIESLPFLWRLANERMSDVYLHYLEWRWGSLVPWTAMRDQGESAVAKARLCVSVQTPDKAKKIMESWDALSVASQALLSRELGLTGVQAENYSWGAPVSEGKGPSFLCYYSPALLKKHIGWKKPSAVEVLAEICRAGRMLYPLRIGADNTFTTIDLAMLRMSVLKTSLVQGTARMFGCSCDVRKRMRVYKSERSRSFLLPQTGLAVNLPKWCSNFQAHKKRYTVVFCGGNVGFVNVAEGDKCSLHCPRLN